MDLSVLIPARNEMFLKNTIDDILANMEGDTEIIAVCDGAWADPPIVQHPRVQLIYFPESVGQRAATNYAAKVSTAKYIMKCDAHCAFDKGFDVKLMADCEKDWTVIPRMYNLHAFDWRCKKCNHTWMQGPKLTSCEKCGNANLNNFERVILWKPKLKKRTDFARFDSDLHFQYWADYKNRPEAQGDIADVMCCVGACWFMHRERYWEIGGLDEKHGSWGQMGVEIACKSWLSGGRQVVNKKTWFSHLFRTQPGFGFPYDMSTTAQEYARQHSRDMWRNNKWPKAKYPLAWLLDKFAPIPDWHDNPKLKGKVPTLKKKGEPIINKGLTTSIIYYTDNQLDSKIMLKVQENLNRIKDSREIISVSLAPIEFGKNFVLDLERGRLTMFRQILKALEESTADIIFFTEHDVLYHSSHFDFIPPRKDVYYYNSNVWKVDTKTGQALYYLTKQTSGLVAYRELLLEHYRKRVERVEREGYSNRMGYEPGIRKYPRGIDNFIAESFFSEFPNVDIRHGGNLTLSRWHQDQFKDKSTCTEWKMADEIPYWGPTKGRFDRFLEEAF
jgi:glycosyltransferase involved in cell wall biosynthesis